jgi:hypothetical protein
MKQCDATMRIVLPLLVLLLAAPAHAGKIPEQQWAAVQAANVHAEHCAEGVNQTIEATGSAIAQVGETWASLDGMPERTNATGLLYWRGLLAECLGRTDHAITDLMKFLEVHANDSTWVEPARDAMRRLERMGVVLEAGPSKPPAGRIVGVLSGGLIAAGGGLTGALAGVRSQHLSDLETLYTSGTLASDAFASVDEQGRSAAQDVSGFTAATVGLSLGGVATVLISALAPDSGGRSLHRVSAVGIATPDGVWLGIGGQW